MKYQIECESGASLKANAPNLKGAMLSAMITSTLESLDDKTAWTRLIYGKRIYRLVDGKVTHKTSK